MAEEKIRTLHPQGKNGVNILKRRYNVLKLYIIQALEEHGSLRYQTLDEMAEKDLSDTFDGKVGWYLVTVKLDLEARGIIERIPKTSPHEVRLTKAK